MVYVAAPFLDNKIQKMNHRRLMILVAALLVIYVGDSVYSAQYPNMGEGITEYSVKNETKCSSAMQKNKELKQTDLYIFTETLV